MHLKKGITVCSLAVAILFLSVLPGCAKIPFLGNLFSKSQTVSSLKWSDRQEIMGTSHLPKGDIGSTLFGENMVAATGGGGVSVLYTSTLFSSALSETTFNPADVNDHVYQMRYANGAWQGEKEAFSHPPIGAGSQLTVAANPDDKKGFDVVWFESGSDIMDPLALISSGRIATRTFTSDGWSEATIVPTTSLPVPGSAQIQYDSKGDLHLIYTGITSEGKDVGDTYEVSSSGSLYHLSRSAAGKEWSKPEQVSPDSTKKNLMVAGGSLTLDDSRQRYLWIEPSTSSEQKPETSNTIVYSDGPKNREVVAEKRSSISQPFVAIDDDGSIVVAWLEIRGENAFSIVYRVRKSGRWSEIGEIRAEGSAGARMHLIQDSRGQIHMFINSTRGIAYRAWAGSGWLPEVIVEPSKTVKEMAATSDSTGNVMLFYVDGGKLFLRKGTPTTVTVKESELEVSKTTTSEKTTSKKTTTEKPTSKKKQPSTTPKLTIVQPKAGSETTASTITVAGNTDPGCTIDINGEKIPVTSDGSFSATFDLTRGINNFVVTAVSQDDKEKTVEVWITRNT